ncbi:DUF2732 family protein [Nissabacter sp. SGAir0207]|uniref:DUF2732 family protein n=1 Tax=Nissabacter sp. SGAir0207 TaxID=2126321 RepID=UPI0010CD315C|nr:DUF2732 family protein [Nissabacter sp. SGAir0207]QCR37031.1 hypothetical protein C1N62_13525 [Nissabacter sp. SGAir0207]QCR38022.1 hypothetical protein C1N62_17935 [Nissabacter sp. SGAir0207]
MRNKQVLNIETGNDDAGFFNLLEQTRLDERRNRAEAMAARLDSLAARITSRQLSYVEAAELLRAEAERINLQAAELH